MNTSPDFRRTDSTDPALLPLIKELDEHLYGIYGDRMEFFNLYNGLEYIKHVVIVSFEDQAVGCGSLKEYESGTVELKRMYVSPDARGRGIGSELVEELVSWASELGYSRMILETGHEMPDAVALYKKNGFSRIPNYGQYVGVTESWCYERVFNR
ncbi:GNAT family N-acetyltransferase [Lewinella sp. 4G2]|uniref:GNAT family N-acetyltransferase n=1 Tax=Lewinella sp. 4G2 TaxID=1803372 RepID=UPI0007B495B1|nr:GNAT family N-acetyltransferase [Lewinella sp. 4G2]OAV43505.1 hypothetical protein A3850_002900 [Lewinella sp. 4G2]